MTTATKSKQKKDIKVLSSAGKKSKPWSTF